MSFIPINDKKWLNVNAIRSYEVSVRMHVEDTRKELGRGLSEVTGQTQTGETILRIETMDGKTETLRGRDADEALAILTGTSV
jgi:hypothetical protein